MKRAEFSSKFSQNKTRPSGCLMMMLEMLADDDKASNDMAVHLVSA
jgi:hypothetical protein